MYVSSRADVGYIRSSRIAQRRRLRLPLVELSTRNTSILGRMLENHDHHWTKVRIPSLGSNLRRRLDLTTRQYCGCSSHSPEGYIKLMPSEGLLPSSLHFTSRIVRLLTMHSVSLFSALCSIAAVSVNAEALWRHDGKICVFTEDNKQIGYVGNKFSRQVLFYMGHSRTTH